ncbi:MAG: ROK family protein [Planctomycetes bacterium]|nr:ROK family protein [Planctomycetota bacterium]
MRRGSSERLWLGLDLGGTAVKAGVVDDRGRVRGRSEVPTLASGGPRMVLDQMLGGAQEAVEAAGIRIGDCAGVGVGCPGPLDAARGIVHFAPNLPGWKGVPLARWISRETGLRTILENDANCAAWGEAWIGAGRRARSFVLYTLGTGVGGGIVLDGRLWRGEHGAGAELGHAPVVFTCGWKCACGLQGCLEAYAGTAALQSGLHRWAGGKPPEPREIFRQLRRGNPLARKSVDLAIATLASGVAGVVAVLDIDLVLVGGGIAGAGKALFGPLQRAVDRRVLPVPGRRVRVRPAALGTQAGIVGAAGWARHTFETSASSRTSTTGRAPSRTASWS